jgi:CO/xanthine dehydrogenase FAD-binding subunit
MKPAPFEYHVPKSLDEALSLLSQHGFDAKVLAGGQSLVPTMNFRLAQPSVLIDINRIAELFYIQPQNGSGLCIGAMTRQREVERSPLVAKLAPLIAETMPHIAHPQIRNRGTIGGSLAHADPSSELPAVMVALDANFLLRKKDGERMVSARDFFIDLFTTALEPDELLTEIQVPLLSPQTGWAFKEIARRHGDYALVGVAAIVAVDANSKCQQARLVFLSVGNGPVVAEQAAQALIGQTPSPKLFQETAQLASEKDIDPPTDIHASSEFRRHLAKVLTEQALAVAFDRAKKV